MGAKVAKYMLGTALRCALNTNRLSHQCCSCAVARYIDVLRDPHSAKISSSDVVHVPSLQHTPKTWAKMMVLHLCWAVVRARRDSAPRIRSYNEGRLRYEDRTFTLRFICVVNWRASTKIRPRTTSSSTNAIPSSIVFEHRTHTRSTIQLIHCPQHKSHCSRIVLLCSVHGI